MNLRELAAEYRKGAGMVSARVDELTTSLYCTSMCREERYRMQKRIALLSTMRREMLNTAHYMEHYHDRKDTVGC